MGLARVSTVSLSVLFILGCAAPEPPPKKTVFDPLTQQMDRARDVQKTVNANTDETRKAVDAQERGEPAP
jgi:PBP1b-binding outer membrane lipoprotein LpoB